MVVLQDLWIGDKLILLKSKRVGIFVGLNGNKARMQVGAKILLVKADNLDPYVESEAPIKLSFDDDKSSPLDFHEMPTSIDLHINVLAPHLENQLPVRIISHQLDALEGYLEKAVAKGLRIITVIHGKGSGALKMEVQHILKSKSYIRFFYDSNDGGATEIHMK